MLVKIREKMKIEINQDLKGFAHQITNKIGEPNTYTGFS